MTTSIDPELPCARGRLNRYFNPFRLASYLLVLYLAGHTFGAVLSTPRFGATSDAVVAQMKSVHLLAQGSDTTWYGFYEGFGWFVTIFFGFSASMTWFLGGMSRQQRRAIAPLTWTLLLAQVAGLVVAWIWFFAAPIVFSLLITVLLGSACLRDLVARDVDPDGAKISTHAARET
jgi:hypothetical protein